MMPRPAASALIRALGNLPESERAALVRALMRRADCTPHGPVWHQLAALAADVSAVERQVIDALELDANGGEVGAIVFDSDLDP